MFLETSRLYFRSYQEEDFEFLYQLLSDPKMVDYIGNGKPRDREGALLFYKWIQESYLRDERLGLKLLIRKEDESPIGHAGLVPQTIEDKQELEIGYWIAVPYWRQGYATEAALALKTFGLDSLRQNRLISLIQEGNTASQKVAKKLGMTVEKRIELGGKNVDVYFVMN